MADKKKCCIVVGHSLHKQGASNPTSGMTEYNFNSLVAIAIKSKAKHSPCEIKIIYRGGSFAKLVNDINNEEPDFIVSLHCNAFNTKATGREVLYSGSRKGIILAKQMHRNITTKGPDRGIKVRAKSGRGGYLLHKTIAPCVIVEPFFIDSPEYFKVDICQLVTDYYTGIQDAFVMLT